MSYQTEQCRVYFPHKIITYKSMTSFSVSYRNHCQNVLQSKIPRSMKLISQVDSNWDYICAYDRLTTELNTSECCKDPVFHRESITFKGSGCIPFISVFLGSMALLISTQPWWTISHAGTFLTLIIRPCKQKKLILAILYGPI